MALCLSILRTFSQRLLTRQLHGTAFCSTLSAPEQLESVDTSSPENKDKEVFYTIGDYQQLIDQNLANRKQIRTLVRNLNDKLRKGQKGYPKKMTPEQFVEVLERPSWNKRQRLLRYFAEKEAKNKRSYPKLPMQYREPMKSWTSIDELPKYALRQNCIFPRVESHVLYTTLEKHVVNHMPFAQKVVLDFAYDHLMTAREINKVCVDIKQLYGMNKWAPAPLNIFFCDFDTSRKESARLVHKLIANRRIPFVFEMTPKSAIDLFPKERVVYLSPEGDEVLDKLDDQCVYVLGALVDKVNQPGVSAQRAKELGVRSARFPASVFLRWKEDDEEKPLHLTHCVEILLRLSSGSSWEEALKCLGKSFVVEF